MSGEDSKHFVKAGKVESSAAEAKAAVEGAGSAELEDAETSAARAKDFDPSVKRDR